MRSESLLARTTVVFLIYLILTFVMTWPLVAGLARDVPGDLGDALLNMWILGWDAEHMPRVVSGQISLTDFWSANIFHPEPLTLSLSETLFAQALQILPVYYVTGNLILCYNLLFLSTFALSGLGMYLLVREYTNNRWAAFLAGLLFAFLPYRVGQVAHIQALSTQWMPLTLYGFRRYITTGRMLALVGGALALVLQNLSNGYYLVFFAPFVTLFVLHQALTSARRAEWRLWLGLATAALVVVAGTAPAIALYWSGRQQYPLTRPFDEIVKFSADVYSYLTASEAMRFSAALRLYPKSEGDLFPGFVALALAAVAIVMTIAVARRDALGRSRWFHAVGPRERTSLRAVATVVVAIIASALTLGLLSIVFTGGFVESIAGIPIRANNAPRIFVQLLIALAALLMLSGKFRTLAFKTATSPIGLAAMLTALAMWMSLGPLPSTRGRIVEGSAIYSLFLDYVPGFSGLRVPARYAMIAALFLVWLAGHGAEFVFRWQPSVSRRAGVLALLSALFFIEAWFAPMATNVTWGRSGFVPPARIESRHASPAVYRHIRTLPDDAVVVEFPFGDPAWELRYVYYATVHWKRLVNGYSGQFPNRYRRLVARFEQLQKDPDGAWNELAEVRPSHAIVHEAAMPPEDAAYVKNWLTAHAFRETHRFDRDVLYTRGRPR